MISALGYFSRDATTSWYATGEICSNREMTMSLICAWMCNKS